MDVTTYFDLKGTQLEWLENEIDRLESLIKTLPEAQRATFKPTGDKLLPFAELGGLYSLRKSLRDSMRNSGEYVEV